MNFCPNCKSENFALIVRGLDIEEIIEELIKLNKIVIEDFPKDPTHSDNSKWMCNVCSTRWGKRK